MTLMCNFCNCQYSRINIRRNTFSSDYQQLSCIDFAYPETNVCQLCSISIRKKNRSQVRVWTNFFQMKRIGVQSLDAFFLSIC